MKSLAKKQSASVTVQMLRETEGCEIPCEDATTVYKKPVSKNCRVTANSLVSGMKCYRVVDQ